VPHDAVLEGLQVSRRLKREAFILAGFSHIEAP
jgi:hypothetical protein